MLKSIRDLFSEEPLTSSELSCGRAFRLVGCLRSGEGDFSAGPVSFIWVVLVGHRVGVRTGRPSCLVEIPRGDQTVRYSRLKRYVSNFVAEHSGQGVPGLDGDWSIDEYSFELPAESKRMIYRCGSTVLPLGNAEVQDHIARYGRAIANASVDLGYPKWLELQARLHEKLPVPEATYLMSVVTPAYNTPPVLLRAMIDSLLCQTYGRWELIVVNASPENEEMREVFSEYDDERIRVVEVSENLGIAGNTNVGLDLCKGDYVSFFDHDDTIESFALAELVRAIRDNGEPAVLYCDEDNVDEWDIPSLPLFKPGYNPDLLLSNNYVIHWLTIRSDILARIERSGDDVNGAQDYDVTFKAVEEGLSVAHIPVVLYHWRIHSGSSAGDPGSKMYAQEAGLRAITAHLDRVDQCATVERGPAYFTYITRFSPPRDLPSLRVVSMGPAASATSEALNRYAERAHVELVECDGPRDVSSALAELLFAACEEPRIGAVIDGGINLKYEDLLALVASVCREGVFSSSPKVTRPDGLLDYAGAIISPRGGYIKMLHLLPEGDGGYVGRSQRPYDAFVVNPACCLFKLDGLVDLDGMPPYESWEYQLLHVFAWAYERDLRNVYEPYACAVKSTGDSYLFDGASLSSHDEALFEQAFPCINGGDPSHNPNFDPCSAYYALNWARFVEHGNS